MCLHRRVSWAGIQTKVVVWEKEKHCRITSEIRVSGFTHEINSGIASPDIAAMNGLLSMVDFGGRLKEMAAKYSISIVNWGMDHRKFF
jgi:hypothetical protein